MVLFPFARSVSWISGFDLLECLANIVCFPSRFADESYLLTSSKPIGKKEFANAVGALGINLLSFLSLFLRFSMRSPSFLVFFFLLMRCDCSWRGR